MYYNFQRRMSRLPQRWRTQRNAIRNANCKTSWIIKILNAHCASGICPVAYLSECPRTPLSVSLLLVDPFIWFDGGWFAAGLCWFAVVGLHLCDPIDSCNGVRLDCTVIDVGALVVSLLVVCAIDRWTAVFVSQLLLQARGDAGSSLVDVSIWRCDLLSFNIDTVISISFRISD